MAIARDWLKTLWAASYKGAPFFVERDDEDGGRRIVIHQFPMRDTPYLEDLGEDKREFEVTAYVASDSADSDAGALVATCATRGPGIVVLPTHGPIMVRCLNFKRERTKDKHGYIAFQLLFIREGATSALVSVAMLANLVFVAADNTALAIATSFLSTIQIANQADFVVSAAIDGAQDAISALDAIRTTEPVDPAVSATQRDAIQSLFTAAPADLIDPTAAASVPAGVLTIARALGDGLPAASALRVYSSAATDVFFASSAPATIYPTPNAQAAAVNADAARRLMRLAALTAYCEAVARVALPDRPAGITLRANVAEFMEGEIDDLPASEIDLYHAICALRDATIAYLSRAILDLAPVITVEANMSLPSLFWAWRLYADPNRSSELVGRNQVAHPSFLPPVFEALAK